MSTHGFDLTLASLRAQLASIAWPRYELRLIDAQRRQCLATRYWTATQLLDPDTVRFLRGRNQAGCDVYFRPYAVAQNAGYLLLDFDHGPCPLAAMRVAGHTPCLIVATSPGHQQAWVRVTSGSVMPAWATAVARWMARQYGADPASAEWRHLGRLAGFTNRKPARLQPNGLPPWVRVVWRPPGALPEVGNAVAPAVPDRVSHGPATVAIGGVEARPSPLYRQCLEALRLWRRFPTPDWSIADYRVARWLLQGGCGAEQVAAILRQGSPGFPRRHANPDDYLRRTVRAAAASLACRSDFSRAPTVPERG
jgi:RepB DNA-primase from phage plasmid